MSCGLYPVSVWRLASCMEVEVRILCHCIGGVYPVSLCRWCVSCVIVQVACILYQRVGGLYPVSLCRWLVSCISVWVVCILCEAPVNQAVVNKQS